MLEELDAKAFSAALHTQFLLKVQDAEVQLELMEVAEINHSPKQETFSIVFRGPLDRPFAQSIQKLEHQKLGSFSLFLVPIARDEKGMYYEAIFNRLRE